MFFLMVYGFFAELFPVHTYENSVQAEFAIREDSLKFLFVLGQHFNKGLYAYIYVQST